MPLILVATAYLDSWVHESPGTTLPLSGWAGELLVGLIIWVYAIVTAATMLGYSLAYVLLWRRIRDFGTVRALACAVITAELVYGLFAIDVLDTVVDTIGLLPLPHLLGALLPVTSVTTGCGALVLWVASSRKLIAS